MWLIEPQTIIFRWGAKIDFTTLMHVVLYTGIVFGLFGYLMDFIWPGRGFTVSWIASIVLLTGLEVKQTTPGQFFDLMDWIPPVGINTGLYFMYFN